MTTFNSYKSAAAEGKQATVAKKNIQIKVPYRKPSIVVASDWLRDSKSFKNVAEVISIVDPGQESFSIEGAINKSFFFYNYTIEGITGRRVEELAADDEIIESAIKERLIASWQDVHDIIRSIKHYLDIGYRKGSLIIHSSNGCGRAPCFEIAASILRGASEQEALYISAKRDRSIRPNLWVIAIIDQELRRGGKLIRVVDDLWATGIIISPYAEQIQMTWKDIND